MAGTGRDLVTSAVRAHALRLIDVEIIELGHGLDNAASAVGDLVLPRAWLDDLEGPRELVGVLHATCPPPSPRQVVANADLDAEHILELDGTLTGIIDWSDAAITAPAVDLARLYRDFGPGFLEELLQVYEPLPGATPRIEFFARCAALEDLAYGQATRRREYVTNAERSFNWLFPRSA